MSTHQIAYMPYIECQKFTFGRVTFFPFYNAETQKLFPSDVLDYLKWYFPKYIDNTGKPKQVVMLSLNDQPLGPWGDDGEEEIRNTVSLLCFLSIWKIDIFFPIVADNFTLYFKNFDPANRLLATRVGGYVHITSLIIGDDVEKVRYVEPDTIGRWNWISSKGPWEKDPKLLEGMSKTLQTSQGEDWFRRLVRTVKIFNTSFHNTGALNYFDQLLLLVTALETFFDVDTSNHNKFANAIVGCIGIRDLTNYSNEINETIRKFAIKLYKVRSKYVHGDMMKQTDFCHPTYGEFYHTGVHTFGLLCKHLLIDHGFIACKDRELEVYMDTKCGLFRLMEESAKQKCPPSTSK